MVRIDTDNKAKLATIITMVTIDGTRRVKLSDCFIEYAQTTSSTPATNNMIQAMTALLEEPGRPGQLFPLGGGRPPEEACALLTPL